MKQEEVVRLGVEVGVGVTWMERGVQMGGPLIHGG